MDALWGLVPLNHPRGPGINRHMSTTDSFNAVTGEGASCRPNIDAAGRRRRRHMSYAMAAAAVGLTGWAAATGAGPGVRALVGLPALASAFGALQARRSTCVVMAVAGRREEGRALPRARADEVRDSRRVSWTIVRDAVLLGLAAAALSASLAIR